MTSARQLDQILSQIFTLLPPKVVGLRTDYLVSADGASRRTLQCEYFGSRHHYCLVSPRPAVRARGLKTLRSSVGVTDDAIANRILDLANELGDLNDLGAWPRFVDDEIPRELDTRGKGLVAGGAGALLQQAVDAIRDGLPGVSAIDLTSATARDGKGTHRKAWWSLRDSEGEQLVAVSANAIPGLLRSYFLREGEGRFEVADRYLGRWAHQARVDQPGLINAFAALVSLEALVRPTRIRLEP